MKMRLLALLLTLTQLFSCGFLAGCGTQDTDPAQTVLYLPLDNRPINDQQVRLFAASLNMTLLTPDEGDYATTLNGALNDAGLQYGDRAAILEWLMENEDKSDIIVLYLDQLLSGGLMNSRCMAEMEPVTLSDGRVFTEYDIIDYLATLAGTHTLYVIDSQLRLALSSGYLDFTATDYSLSRKYGLVERPAFDAESGTIDDVIAGYPLAAGGGSALDAAELTAEERDAFSSGERSTLSRYLAIRERKLRLNAYAIETLSSLPSVRYLFGVDDSAVGNNIQSAEFAYLKQLSGGNLDKLSAIDCLGQLALASLYADQTGGEAVRVAVRFFGSSDSKLNFAGHTINEAIDQVIALCGGTRVENAEDADVEVLVACDSETDEQTAAASAALVAQLNQNRAAHVPSIYVDFASRVNTAIVSECELTMLLGAGLHANGSGASAIMGISQGLARYRALSIDGHLNSDANAAFVEDLLFRFAKGYYWNSGYKSEMSTYLSELGLDANNLNSATDDQLSRIDQTLTGKIVACSSGITENFTGGSYVSSLAPYRVGTIRSVAISDCSYPWRRTFEFTAQFKIRLK